MLNRKHTFQVLLCTLLIPCAISVVSYEVQLREDAAEVANLKEGCMRENGQFASAYGCIRQMGQDSFSHLGDSTKAALLASLGDQMISEDENHKKCHGSECDLIRCEFFLETAKGLQQIPEPKVYSPFPGDFYERDSRSAFYKKFLPALTTSCMKAKAIEDRMPAQNAVKERLDDDFKEVQTLRKELQLKDEP